MSKIITKTIQATNTSEIFTLPNSGTPGGLLTTDTFGNLSFTQDPSLNSVTAPTVKSNTTIATTLVAPYVKSTPTSATFTLPTTQGPAGSFLQNNGSGVLSFQNVVISLYGTSNPTIATVANPGVVYMNTSTYQYFVCGGSRIVSGATWYLWIGSQGTYIGFPQGQTAYTTYGTYTFTVPAAVTALSVVLVGGGGGGYTTWANSAGGGGALAYATFNVTPNTNYTVYVGAGGTRGSNGNNSYIVDPLGNTLFTAQGGSYAATSTRATPVSGTITCYGGQGGLCSQNGYGGGGGAGGYGITQAGSDAVGGDGKYGTSASGGTFGLNNGAGTGGAGGGGVGYQSSTYGFGGGGGVGLLGLGTSGAQNTNYAGNTFYAAYGGFGGSGGDSGAGDTNGTQVINGTTYYSGCGGMFGGGGGGSGTSLTNNSLFCNGGTGGARIIWGTGRSYPSTNTGNVTPIN
jgi:hypothetical protein